MCCLGEWIGSKGDKGRGKQTTLAIRVIMFLSTNANIILEKIGKKEADEIFSQEIEPVIKV